MKQGIMESLISKGRGIVPKKEFVDINLLSTFHKNTDQ